MANMTKVTLGRFFNVMTYTFPPHCHAVFEVDFVFKMSSASPGFVRPRHVSLTQDPQIHP